jgi:hypothetical protein
MIVVAAGALAACGLGEGDSACWVRFAEPLVTVQVVTDSASGAPVAVVEISNVRIGGLSFMPAALVDPQRAPVRQATAEGDVVRCVVSCGFGSTEGPYELAITAPGYRPRMLSFTAQYSTVEPGCPTLVRGGFKLSTRLARL